MRALIKHMLAKKVRDKSKLVDCSHAGTPNFSGAKPRLGYLSARANVLSKPP